MLPARRTRVGGAVAGGALFLLAAALAGCDSGARRATVATTAKTRGCEDTFAPLAVAAVCGVRVGAGFDVTVTPATDVHVTKDSQGARLFTARPLAPGDHVAFHGRAPRAARLTLVVVDGAGLGVLATFDRLGLERGGTSTVVIGGSERQPRFRLELPGGERIEPAAVVPRKGYRAVTDLRVRRQGSALVISFRSPAALADVYELNDEAVESGEGLYGVGEVEGEAVIAHRTLRTRAGATARLTLPLREGAEFVYVQPLSRRIVGLPALSVLPTR